MWLSDRYDARVTPGGGVEIWHATVTDLTRPGDPLHHPWTAMTPEDTRALHQDLSAASDAAGVTASGQSRWHRHLDLYATGPTPTQADLDDADVDGLIGPTVHLTPTETRSFLDVLTLTTHLNPINTNDTDTTAGVPAAAVTAVTGVDAGVPALTHADPIGATSWGADVGDSWQERAWHDSTSDHDAGDHDAMAVVHDHGDAWGDD